jgi:hypothetical protein
MTQFDNETIQFDNPKRQFRARVAARERPPLISARQDGKFGGVWQSPEARTSNYLFFKTIPRYSWISQNAMGRGTHRQTIRCSVQPCFCTLSSLAKSAEFASPHPCPDSARTDRQVMNIRNDRIAACKNPRIRAVARGTNGDQFLRRGQSNAMTKNLTAQEGQNELGYGGISPSGFLKICTLCRSWH